MGRVGGVRGRRREGGGWWGGVGVSEGGSG